MRSLILALTIGIVSVQPCHAEQPPSEAERYLAKYAEMVKALQEVKFDFTGTSTRSTATEGIAGGWKNKGTIHVSESCKSFHSDTNAILAMAGEPPTDTGIAELLVTPAEIRDVMIGDASPDYNGVTINLNTKPRGDEWAEQMANSEFGILCGLAPIGDQGAMSLLTACHSADLESVQDPKGLRGFKVRAKDATIQVLFNPSDNDRLVQVQVSRSADGLGVDDVTRETLTIEDVQFVNSKPSMMTVHITTETCGGELSAADLASLPKTVINPKKKLEPDTSDYSYEISSMKYVAADHTPVFIPVHTIPDGTTDVTVDGNRPYVWQNGKPVKRSYDFARASQSTLPGMPGLPTR